MEGRRVGDNLLAIAQDIRYITETRFRYSFTLAPSMHDELPNDAHLVAAALAGDDRAFGELAHRYQRAITAVAYSRLGDHAWAEDAVQEALLAAHRWLHTYNSIYSFRTWLWTIVLNQCTRIEQKRGRARRRFCATLEQAEATGQTVAHDPSPLAALVAQETSDHVHLLLDRLPEGQADALRLRFFGQLKFEELAAALGLSESGAKNRVRLGLLQLSAWLQPAATDSTDASQDSPQVAPSRGDSA